VTAKKLATYRVDEAKLKAVSAKASARGETVTDVIDRAFDAYIRDDAPAEPVYTAPEGSAAPPVVLRAPEPEPARKTAAKPRTGQQGESAPKAGNCKHPRVHGKGVCPDCFTYVASK
jgi:hypothetical protein